MKKMLNSLVLAAAALGANAQTPPTAAQADIQKRANNTLSIPLGGDAEISTTNTNSKNTTAAAITLGNGPLLRLAADTDSNALAAIGLQIGNNGSLVAGISRARESISGVDANGVAYNTKLSGKSEFFMLNLHNLSPEIRRLSVEAIRKSVSDKHLMTSSKDDTQITVSITHIQQVIDTLDATIYRDTTHTSTKTDTYRTTYNTDARGGRSTLARLGMEIAVGKNGVLTLTASQLQTQLPGLPATNNRVASALYTEYLPKYNANISAGLNTDLRLTLAAQKAVNKNISLSLSAYGDTKSRNGLPRDIGANVTLRYTWDADSVVQNLGIIPETPAQQLHDILGRINNTSEYQINGLTGLVRVVATEQRALIASTVTGNTQTTETVVEKPKPPVVPPGAPTCTSDDTANTINCGSLDPATLEMSLDSGASWASLVTTGHTGNKSVQVRVKASGTTPASPATTLTFTETTTGSDTTAPTQTSPTNLGTFTLGSSLTQTLVFDEDIATATIGSLPTGVTATRTISGKTVSVTLTVNPLTFVFSSVTQSIPFTLTVTDAANNTRATNESASATDVAPNFPGQADATRNDDGGFVAITPVTNICPPSGSSDGFGRMIVSCTVTVTNPPSTGGLSYNNSTNSIEGTIDVGQNSSAGVQRVIKVQGSTLTDIDNSVVNIINNG